MEIKEVKYGSDISGTVMPESERARVQVDSHPDTPEAPPKGLDATREEAEALRKLGVPVVELLVTLPGGESERIFADPKKFNAMFKAVGRPVVEVLAEAPTVGKRRRETNGSEPEESDYNSPHKRAGFPKRGKTSQAEKDAVNGWFPHVNDNLTREGERPLELGNSEHVSRYELSKLAAVAAANGGQIPEAMYPELFPEMVKWQAEQATQAAPAQ